MKTRNLKTKTLSILLTIVMLLSMLPMSAFAADEKPTATVFVEKSGTFVYIEGESIQFQVNSEVLILYEPHNYFFEGDELNLVLRIQHNDITIIDGHFNNTVENIGMIADPQ